MTQTLSAQQRFTQDLGIEHPIIAGPMYPCSNIELIAAVSNAGGIGVIQPISLTYAFDLDFREGIQRIKKLTDQPIGMNALIEKSSKKYHKKMQKWIDIALEEGVRFFITSLGKPDWVAEKVHAYGGLVYHDVTEHKWAKIGLDCGADGLICVNNRAGGHAGSLAAEELFKQVEEFHVPVVCAGGISNAKEYQQMLEIGYAACQLGTRFIASQECSANEAYKQAIIQAQESDIVLSENITGIPVSVINTEYMQQRGLKMGSLAQLLLQWTPTKHFVRTLYALRSIWQFKKSSIKTNHSQNFWQAGKSVKHIHHIKSCNDIIKQLTQAVT